MKAAIAEAKKAEINGDVPVGAIIVLNNEIIAKSFNRRESEKDPTAHAEIAAIKKAAKKLESWRLNECEIYVTKEPCPMCAGAIQQARLKKLVYGVKDEKSGYAGSLCNVLEDKRLNYQVEIVSGILENECRTLLQDFFRKKRIS